MKEGYPPNCDHLILQWYPIKQPFGVSPGLTSGLDIRSVLFQGAESPVSRWKATKDLGRPLQLRLKNHQQQERWKINGFMHIPPQYDLEMMDSPYEQLYS